VFSALVSVRNLFENAVEHRNRLMNDELDEPVMQSSVLRKLRLKIPKTSFVFVSAASDLRANLYRRDDDVAVRFDQPGQGGLLAFEV
jgi:hypothetical protein